DVRVALHDEGARRLELADAVDRCGRLGAVEGEVAGDEDRVRTHGLDGRPHGGECRRIAMDIGEDGDPRRHRRTDASGMMKLRVASQATSPSTLATARPRPNRRPSFSIVTSRRSMSPGVATRLKRQSSMPANNPMRSPNPGCLAT